MKNMRKESDLPSIIMVTATSIGLGLLAIYPEAHRNSKLVMLLAPIGLGLAIIVLIRRVDRVRQVAEKARRRLIMFGVGVFAGVITAWISRLPIIAELPLGILLPAAVIFGAIVALAGLRLTRTPELPQVPVSRPSTDTGQTLYEVGQFGLKLTWLGMIEDRVGPLATGRSPDGHPDGTFLLTGTLERAGWIERVDLQSVDREGQPTGLHWTRPPRDPYWHLGVARQEEGEWNTVYATRVEISSNTPFALRLYASDHINSSQRHFTVGKRFKATLHFEDGHSEGIVAEISQAAPVCYCG